MCAESVAFVWVECSLQQCAEDGGLNVPPTGIRSFEEEPELIAVEGKYFGGFKESAVELEDVAAKNG